MTNVIRIEKLSRNFLDGSGNELNILTEIDAQFSLGQTVSIVGSSGSGKSTFLHLLGGLDTPSSGKVFFKDEDIFEYGTDKRSAWRNRYIGFVFQSHHLLPDFSALENVMLPGMISGLSREESIPLAEDLLEQVGLKDRSSHRPGQLSGGEQQRVAIARALINEPEIILADEPTGNLDVQTGKKVGSLLNRICSEKNKILILVTHNTKLAADMDIQYVLNNGKLTTV